MIYRFTRFISGKYLNGVIDYYTNNQIIFNSIVVILGFVWIVYLRNKNKGKKSKKQIFWF
ncbi:hypothetical protein GCM10008906_00530 [Clostridium oceanicum]|uniref:Uncharacterized protein n=1 Tax=Clostridium oceanicum TaxID=1543 RepID=A0ABN1J8W1_9CLOT